MIREAAVADAFYPGTREELHSLLDDLFASAKKGKVKNGMVVPHAGYVYSGKTAAVGYKAMLELLKEKPEISNVIILGPSHQVYFEGLLIDANEEWETPLGRVKLRKIPEIKEDSQAHAREHSLEVQVPFIQVVSEKLGRELTITPIAVGDINDMEAKNYAEVLLKQQNCFFIISSDLSHFLSLDYAEKTDKETISNILDFKTQNLEACGKMPLMIAIEMAKIKKWKFRLLDYSTSADATGDESAVVGYACIGF